MVCFIFYGFNTLYYTIINLVNEDRVLDMKIASLFKVLVLLLLSSGFLQAQDVIYSENFSDDIGKGFDGNGLSDITGVDWALDISSCILSDNFYAKVKDLNSGRLEVKYSQGEAIWMSPDIDVSNYTDVNISIYVKELGSSISENKYVKLYYKTSINSEEILFPVNGLNEGNFSENTSSVNNLNVNHLFIVAKLNSHLATNRVYIDDILVTGIPQVVSNDALTLVLEPLTQVAYLNISSIDNDINSSRALLKFTLSEPSGADDLDTKIAAVKFTNVATDNKADLSNQFQAFALHNGTDFIPINSLIINPDEIILNFNEGDFNLPDKSSQEYELRGYLKTSGIIDGEIVQLELEGGASGITTYTSGSSFDTGNSVAVNSPEHQISVVATQLNFASIPSSSLIKNTNFSVSVDARDINGSLDLDANKNVGLSIQTGTGILSGILSNDMLNGQVVFDDLIYNIAEDITLQASGLGLESAISNSISIISSQSTELNLSAWTPSSLNISSIANSVEDAVEVYRFSINDIGDDIESTFLNSIRLMPGDNNNVNWEDEIEGFIIKVGDKSLVADYVLSNSGVDISISNSELLREISDGNSKVFSIHVYLKTVLSDGDILQIKVDNSHSGWSTSGSALVPNFIGDLNGPEFKIDVIGTHLNFASIPLVDVEFTSNFEVSVNLTDLNDNLDLNANQVVNLSLVDGKGNLSGTLTKNLNSGITSFDDLSYNYSEEIKLTISGVGLKSKESELIHFLPSKSSDAHVVEWVPENLHISSLFVSEDSFKEVFRFQVVDQGDDQVSSVLKSIRLISGSENTMNWEDEIGGFQLKINGEIADVDFIPSASSLLINFAENEELVKIPDGQTINLSLYVYLNEKSADGEVFQAAIENIHSQWEVIGTQLLNEFPGNLENKLFVVDVEGSELSFIKKPPKNLIPNSDFEIELKLIDKFGNQDLNTIKEAQVSLASGTGNLISDKGLRASFIDGKFAWADLKYDKAENFTLLIEVDGLEPILSDNISSLDANSSLISAEIPVSPQVLNPLAIDADNYEVVFNFAIKDEAKLDTSPTLVSSMKFYNKLIDSGLDWVKHLAGAVIKRDGEIVARTTKIENEYISFSSTDIEIKNGEREEFELAIYFKKSLIPDHASFQVEIRSDHGWKTSSTGSSLVNQLSERIVSVIHQIDVNADRLSIISYPKGIEQLEYFDITIAAVDAFQNIDLDKTSSISLNAKSGILSQTGVIGNLEAGKLEVSDLSYSGEKILELTASGDLKSVTKEIFVQEKNVILSDDFESRDLNFWENTEDWTVSSYKYINGSNSLKHNLTNAIGSSCVVCPLSNIQIGSESIFWEFLLHNSDWDPTSSNFFVFHLLMDFNDPELADNLYSVGINLSGSDDRLSLWKTDNENVQLLVKSDFDWNSEETVAVKVEYNARGEWKLSYNRLGDKTNYLAAGTAVSEVNTDVKNWYSGLEFNFETASRAGQLWFDDIKVDSYNSAPFIKNYNLFSDSIVLNFSEDLNFLKSSELKNFELQLGEVSVPIKEIKSTDFNDQLVLVFENELVTAKYDLQVSRVEDLKGAISNVETIQFDFYKEVHEYDLVINEIFADESPVVDLPEYEFIEIYNTSDYPIKLEGFKLKVGNTEKILNNYKIPSHEYLILCSNAAVEFYKEYGNVLGISSFPSLTNSGTNISLESSKGVLMDEIIYSSGWYVNENKKDGGWSLERVDVTNYCSTVSNWKASQNEIGGTPGEANSVKDIYQDIQAPDLFSYNLISNQVLLVEFSEIVNEDSALSVLNYTIEGNSISSISKDSDKIYMLHFEKIFEDGKTQKLVINNLTDECGNSKELQVDFVWHEVHEYDLVINEIFADESPVVGLPEYEFIEIYNTSDYPIKLEGFKLKVGNTEKILNNYKIPSHEYLILCSNAAVEFYKEYGNVLGISSFPSLTNSGTNISLESSKGVLMDEIIYSSGWYVNENKKDGGWSLERVDVTNYCSTVSNWKASQNEIGGTPGEANSVKDIYQDIQAPDLFSYNLISNQVLLVEFSEIVNEDSALSVLNYTIEGNSISSISKDSDKIYMLHFEKIFEDGKTQKLVINNLTDECGNSKELQVDFVWHEVHEYDLVINEIFADESPVVGLPEYEFIEIYNTSDYPIKLEGFKLKVGNTEKILDNYEIPSHAYLILCSNAASEYYKEFGNVLGISSFPSLTNSGTNISLESSAEILMDEITYSSDWYGDENKNDGGWSLERVDVTNYFWQADNWRASLNAEGGTPGQGNSIEALNPDLSKPKLLNFELIGTNAIILFFSESLAFNQALDILNYSLNGDVGHPVSVMEIDDEIFALRLDFSSDFENNIQYQLVLSDYLVDLAGNSIEEHKVEFILAETPHAGDLVINEVLFNPYPNGADYVELFNISDRKIDVKDLLIANRDENYQLDAIYPLSERSRIMEADAYLLLSTDTANVKLNYSHVDESTFLQLSKIPSFNDDEGRVVILNRDNDQLDDFAYNEAMHFSQLTSTEGVSLERINPNKDTNSNSNWISASQTVDFGTPGMQNSSYDIDEVEVNEIGFKSKIFSPDNDGVDDRLVINFDLEKSGYVANIRVYNSLGREVRRLASNMTLSTKDELFWDGLLANKERAPIGIYAFYFELFHSDGEVKVYKKTCVLGRKFK